jgi:hypothetical protein
MFVHHNSAKQARRFARAASFFTASIKRPGLALACGLLAGCAAPGVGPSPMADDQNAAPKIDPAVAQTGGVGSEAKASAFAVDAVSLQRRKQAIADMIESRLAYRARFVEGGAVKLTEAQFAGPFEYTRKPLFTAPVTETLYCTSVIENLPYWPFPELRAAVIRVEKLDGGFERLSAEIRDRAEPPECRKAPYGAFPELDQARAKRRKSLGLPD